MYRIKAKREDGWVPLLANPDIIDQYSENVTDTLHKKNLLLLGEDRYLTTLMLKTFPCRKLIFLAAAKCRTFVPDRFSILLSQRRRWINSTVHNLCELVLVRDLCGTLCCSMQFVLFMELVGSLVLPAAIIFTGVLIVSAFLGNPQWIPLILLIAILGLPAVLILFTTREIGYILWMFIYLISLPIWNFVLPVYAFWYLDDFSWGETRRLDAESGKSTNAAGGHGVAGGDFDWKMITMKRWQEYDEEFWE
jgi:chitin synthase